MDMSSGWHVPKEHIDTLISAALYWRKGRFYYPALGRYSLVDSGPRDRHMTEENADEVGEMLMQYSYKAVPDEWGRWLEVNGLSELPAYHFVRLPAEPDPMTVLNFIDFYLDNAYGYYPERLTSAWWFMYHLTKWAIRRLPRYRPTWYGYPIEDH